MHDVRTLAAALVVRLRTDARGELAEALAALFPGEPSTAARALAAERGAASLVASLVMRLRADGRADTASAVAAVFASATDDAPIIDPHPVDPHDAP
jgi:hypothetical protein